MKPKIVAVITLALLFLVQLKAQDSFSGIEKVVFGCYSESLESFKQFASEAKKLGATHIAINAEDLPLAYWELEPDDDPYPAWVISNPGILKINPPEKLLPFIPDEYGESVMGILEKRCQILRELDLKASFHTFEPQMLPEEFFISHPNLRGPRTDNPIRSRNARFAPSMSHPDLLEMYTEALTSLKTRCPEIDILEFRTNDSGAGIEWSEALYAGANGNLKYRSLEMSERIHLFLKTLQGKEDELRYIADIHVYNTKESQKEKIAKNFVEGLAVDNMEGPEAGKFKNEVGALLYYRKPFAPVPGIPCPVRFLEQLEEATGNSTKRLFILIGDYHNQPLYFSIYKKFLQQPTHSADERLNLLCDVATEEVGEDASPALVDTWLAIDRAQHLMDLMSSGGSIFILGCVHQRWLVRPLVPFPGKLSEEEKKYYRVFQFQAGSEQEANDLLNLQGRRVIDGHNGYRLANRILANMNREIYVCRKYLNLAVSNLKNGNIEKYRILLARVEVFLCLIKNVQHTMYYQILLEKALNDGPDGINNSRVPSVNVKQEMMKTAQNEIENVRKIVHYLQNKELKDLLDHAKNKDEEYHRKLGPDIMDQLKNKIAIMNKYWSDYYRIDTN